MLNIHSDKVTKFFEKYEYLDTKNTMEMLIDLLDKFLQNLDQEIHKNKTNDFFEMVHAKLLNIENNTKSNQKSLENLVITLSEQISTILTTQRDYLLLNMRDTIKANQSDVKESLEQTIQYSQSVITDRLDVITKHDILSSLFKKELEVVHKKFKEEISENIQKDSIETVLEKVEDMIHVNYKNLDHTLKTRMESYFTSNQNASMFSDIISRLDTNVKTVEHVNDFLLGQQNSSMKGKQGEKRLEIALAEAFPTAEIRDTSGKSSCGDFIVSRRNRKDILIDTKDYKRVVPTEEIDKIIRDVENNKCHGILISQNSGIANKHDMEIGVHNHHILVYIHNACYESSKLLLAANVIDYLDPILQTQVWNGEHTLTNDMLSTINDEYRNLARQKESLIENVKVSHSHIINEIGKINLSCLASFLDSKFQNTDTTEHICDCGYRGKNKQALSAHRRYCKNKDTN